MAGAIPLFNAFCLRKLFACHKKKINKKSQNKIEGLRRRSNSGNVADNYVRHAERVTDQRACQLVDAAEPHKKGPMQIAKFVHVYVCVYFYLHLSQFAALCVRNSCLHRKSRAIGTLKGRLHDASVKPFGMRGCSQELRILCFNC